MSVTEQNNLFYRILTERWVLCWGRNWYVQNCWLRKVQAGISENKFSRICRLMGRSRYCLCCCSCFLPCTGSWLNRVSNLWVRNCHLVLQQDKGNLWTLKGLWVFEDCGLPAVEVNICSLGVLWWAAQAQCEWITDPEHPPTPWRHCHSCQPLCSCTGRRTVKNDNFHHRCKENIWFCKHNNLVCQTWDFPWSCQFTGNSVYSCPLQPNSDWMHLLGEISQELERLLVHQFYKTATGK